MKVRGVIETINQINKRHLEIIDLLNESEKGMCAVEEEFLINVADLLESYKEVLRNLEVKE